MPLVTCSKDTTLREAILQLVDHNKHRWVLLGELGNPGCCVTLGNTAVVAHGGVSRAGSPSGMQEELARIVAHGCWCICRPGADVAPPRCQRGCCFRSAH